MHFFLRLKPPSEWPSWLSQELETDAEPKQQLADVQAPSVAVEINGQMLNVSCNWVPVRMTLSRLRRSYGISAYVACAGYRAERHSRAEVELCLEMPQVSACIRRSREGSLLDWTS